MTHKRRRHSFQTVPCISTAINKLESMTVNTVIALVSSHAHAQVVELHGVKEVKCHENIFPEHFYTDIPVSRDYNSHALFICGLQYIYAASRGESASFSDGCMRNFLQGAICV